jgi:hypothetical protein
MNRPGFEIPRCYPRAAVGRHGGLALICVFSAITAVPASAGDDDIAAIELRRLLEPTPSEIAQEEAGRIYIYDGLRDKDVEQAMDKEFDRVEHMMFIRVRKTDPDGDVVRNPDTGAAEVEDDGC